jgi:hypothetical protein
MLGDDGTQLCEDTGQAPWQGFPRGELDGTAREAAELSRRMHLDDTIARVFSAAVDPEDAHVSAFYRGN